MAMNDEAVLDRELRSISRMLPIDQEQVVDLKCFWTDRLFWAIISLKISATLFAYFVYSKFSPFLDAALYLSPPENYETPFLRTRQAILIYSTLKSAFRSDLMIYLLTSFLVGYVLWRVVRPFYHWINKPLFYVTLMLPHFLICSGVVGKEAFVIVGYLLLISVCVDWLLKQHTSFLALGFGLYFASFHPHYLLAYGYLGMATWVLSRPLINQLNAPKWLVFILGIYILSCGFLLFCLWDILTPYLLHTMKNIQAMFLGQVGGQVRTNRHDITWLVPLDFIKNLWWGLPISMIGPTLKEAIARPILFPVFVEGCVALGLFGVLFHRMIRLAFTYPQTAAIFLLGFVPAVIIGLFVNYPVGIFNPGSAIRYKQSLVPLFYFYPLLVMAALKRGARESN